VSPWTDVAGCRLRDRATREIPDVSGRLRAPAVSDVRQARQPGLVGGVSKAHDRKELEARRPRWPRNTTARSSSSAASPAVSWNARCWATRRRSFPALRNSCPRANSTTTRTSTCSTARKPRFRRSCRRKRPRKCAGWPLECYRAVECEGMARAILLLEAATGRVYINEDQHHPGFTSHQHVSQDVGATAASLFRAHRTGLIELALDRHQRKKSHTLSRDRIGNHRSRHGKLTQSANGHIRRVASHAGGHDFIEEVGGRRDF